MHLRARIVALCLIVSALSGCAGNGTAPDAFSAQDYPTLAARAAREIKRADEKGFLWLNTESHLARSREAYAAGDEHTAMTLAQQALEEALLAQKQAADGAKAKPDFTYRR